ncbi:MAG TPA: cation:proton antiporter [Oxalicibacterium sp.]|nr:cation:proton antiporter [Oxalicibacterium sp.]
MHEQTPSYLNEILLFLMLAGILIPLLQRFRLNPILGFLTAGVLFGPYGIGRWASEFPWLINLTITHEEGVSSLAELGVLFLMFRIGLELSMKRLWQLRAWVFGAGLAQVVLSALVIALLAHRFENSIEVSLLLGFMLALSSTAVAMQWMASRGMAGSRLGQAALSMLMFQDLAVVPILIWIGMAGRSSDVALLPLVGLTIAKSAAVILLIYLVGGRVLQPLFRYLLARHRPDIFMALTLLSLIGIAAITNEAGLSTALGAFLAGLLLAETEFRHEVEVTVEPFRELLMGMFFLSVGMRIDLRAIAESPLWIPLSVLGLFAIKGAIIALLLRIGRFNWGRALEGGVLLGQGSEFAFVALGYALSARLLQPAAAQFMMLVVALGMFATPPLARLGSLFGDSWEKRHRGAAAESGVAENEIAHPRIVIAGFGRVGQLLGQVLAAQGVAYVALENDARLVARLRAQGFPVYFGDAEKIALLEKMEITQAAVIVVTMDNPASALQAVRAMHRHYPELPLFARARDEKHAAMLKHAGAMVVMPETLEAGLQLSAAVLTTLNIDDAVVAEAVQHERERRIALMQDNAPD